MNTLETYQTLQTLLTDAKAQHAQTQLQLADHLHNRQEPAVVAAYINKAHTWNTYIILVKQLLELTETLNQYTKTV